MKVFPQGELRLDAKTLLDNLGKNNFIFVGSSCDMFADKIPKEWIEDVLERCSVFNDNTYLFQTKNPKRFLEFMGDFPEKSIFGTTIESNRDYDISKSPSPRERAKAMSMLEGIRTMVSIEPIMDFDLTDFVDMIKHINPNFVSIGADSKGHNLPEPSWEKVQQLITELKKFTEVKVKNNLERLKNVQIKKNL